MTENNNQKAKLGLLTSMFIFGTIGIFRRYIPLPSGMVACVRGLVGTLFLLALVTLKKEKISKEAIQKNFKVLVISGVAIGFNWILLFEAYQYTSVAIATLCYYMAPMIVIFASAILLKEKLTKRKVLCALVALAGMVLVSGVLQAGFTGLAEMKGILLGLGAAALYASVILMNKKLKDINAYDKTIVQLAAAAIVLIPYVLLVENWMEVTFTPLIVVMLLIVGIVHTGWAYALYFGSMDGLKAQTIALFSYLDPIVAILLSALLLKEEMGVAGFVGAVLVLGAAMLSEKQA